MAAGLFPVVTAIPGNAEWVSDGKTALTFADGDAVGLGCALVKAATNRVLRDDAAQQNRQTIAERAIWEDNMAVIEKVFEDLVWRAK
jgi:glycosyltransferase involved in cell wall biosynthesis